MMNREQGKRSKEWETGMRNREQKKRKGKKERKIAKDCTFYCRNDLDFCPLIVWAIDDVTCEGCKGPVEEHKRIGYR